MTENGRRISATAVLAVALLGYPALVLAAGGARFPSREDCARVAPAGTTAELDLVFGQRDTPTAAEELRASVAAIGYVDAEVMLDGCGRWEVFYDGIESYEQGAESREEARAAGLKAELELDTHD